MPDDGSWLTLPANDTQILQEVSVLCSHLLCLWFSCLLKHCSALSLFLQVNHRPLPIFPLLTFASCKIVFRQMHTCMLVSETYNNLEKPFLQGFIKFPSRETEKNLSNIFVLQNHFCLASIFLSCW